MRGPRVQVRTCNAAISACEKGGHAEHAFGLFHGMPAKSLTPDVITYSATISACEKDWMWQEALQLLVHLVAAAIAPNLITLNSAVSACDKAGQWQHAVCLLDNIPQFKLQADVISFNSAISACGTSTKWQHALALLQRASECAEPNTVTANAAMSACQRGSLSAALHIWGWMLEAQIPPNGVTFPVLLQVLRNSWAQATKLLRSMARWTFQPDMICYSLTFEACERAGQHLRARRLMDQTSSRALSVMSRS
ncbi:unnamed protein product [Effrenium voratum]|nr:unnamed protein product [Effrenium voratum]